MTIDVFGADEQHDQPVALDELVALARKVLDAEGARGGAEVSLLFVDEPTIASLNAEFRHKEGPTDVLSFQLEDDFPTSGRTPDAGGPGPGEPPELDMPDLLGDVVVCPAVAAANAASHGVPYADELALLVVHGCLHLLGWDHEVTAEAERMEARERALLVAHWSADWAGR